MDDRAKFVVFAKGELLAEGPAAQVVAVLKDRFDRAGDEGVLVFDQATGRGVDFDLSGTLREVMERVQPSTPRGPGRPRLGVTSREIALLPRHWEWLEEQPSGISAALRRLVEEAMKKAPGQEQARRLRASLNNVLTAVAGNREHYEEATRALFSDDVERLELLVRTWPRDLRDYTIRQASAARRAAQAPTLEPA